MAKIIRYIIRDRHGYYLQKIEINENYSHTGTAPTMGNLHTPCEYRTVWGHHPCAFEPLTLASYIKILLEEYRWETRQPIPFTVSPWFDRGSP